MAKRPKGAWKVPPAPESQEKKQLEELCSIADLFRFTTATDKAFFAIGMLCAAVVGVAQPFMMVYFSAFFEDVGSTLTDPTASFGLASIIDMAVAMCVIGGIMWAGTFVYWSAAEIVSARNVSALKKAYVTAIVRQDVGWFDISKPQELATRIGESITLIHKGTRGTALLIFEGVGMLVTGLILAFMYEWRVALVVLAVSPLIGVCGWLMAFSMNAMSHAVQEAYGKAGGIATEALTAVRTVSAFGLNAAFSER